MVDDPTDDMVDRVGAHLQIVRARIESAGGRPDAIRIVAVTKGHGVDAVRAALAHGLADLGENYADELVSKALAVAAEPGTAARWHFQGRLQTNKINRLAAHVSLWQTVDTAERARALAQRVPGAAVLVQLDVSGVAGRGGASEDDVPSVVSVAREAGLDVQGLMSVAPLPGVGAPSAAEAFGVLARLADRLGLPERSMGMSDDLEDAVRAGSTMVRLGGALFGPRQQRP